MKISYVSNLISKKAFSETFGYGLSAPAQQAQRYNRLLAKGLSGKAELLCISQPSVVRENNKSLIIELPDEIEEGISFSYTKIVNIPVIKNLLAAHFAEKLQRAFSGDIVVCDLLCISACKGALKAAKKSGKKAIGIVTDIPDFLPGKAGGKTFRKLFYENLNKCDGFVLLTESMADYLNIKKPYVVIEGICEEASSERLEKFPENVVLYAGGLEKDYGVIDLCEAFCDIEGAELWLYGKGRCLDEIVAFSEKYPNIKYKGVAKNDEILALEKKATLLVNPRNPIGEFTKYSFPSKNMEYMSSGTPVLCYMLPGMPNEYRSYIYEIKADIKSGLTEILAKDRKELDAFGLSAKEFVLKNKNLYKQADKVLELFK